MIILWVRLNVTIIMYIVADLAVRRNSNIVWFIIYRIYLLYYNNINIIPM